MTGLPGGAITLLFHAFAWISAILEIAGLIICIRYVRLSSSMPLLVLSFAGSSATALGHRVIEYLLIADLIPQSMTGEIFAMLSAINVMSTAALVLGLLLVFRDLRERFHFLREVHEGTRAPNAQDEKPV